MPRPPRDLAPGIQHVGVGAAGPANYFRDDVDHATWTRLFVRTLKRYHSYATTIGLADTFPWVDASPILDTLSTDRREAIPKLRALVELG